MLSLFGLGCAPIFFQLSGVLESELFLAIPPGIHWTASPTDSISHLLSARRFQAVNSSSSRLYCVGCSYWEVTNEPYCGESSWSAALVPSPVRPVPFSLPGWCRVATFATSRRSDFWRWPFDSKGVRRLFFPILQSEHWSLRETIVSYVGKPMGIALRRRFRSCDAPPCPEYGLSDSPHLQAALRLSAPWS